MYKNMKRILILTLSILMVVTLFSGCAAKQSTFDTKIYEKYIDNLSSSTQSCGYQYTKNGATYTILQCGNDIRIDFESTANPDMNMSACRIGTETVYVSGSQYFVDAANKYSIPVSSDSSVVSWVFDELKKYPSYQYKGNVDIDGVVYDVIGSSMTQKINNIIDFDYDTYEVFFTYKDGQNYHGKYFDCSDKSNNLFSGNLPSELIADNTWALDVENKKIYNTKTNESYSSAVDLVDSYKYDASAPKESVKSVEVYINRETQQIFKILIQHSDDIDEYRILQPGSINPIDTSGKTQMDAEAAEYIATMVLIIVQSL